MQSTDEIAQRILGRYVRQSLVKPILQLCATRARVNLIRLRSGEAERLLSELDVGIQAFVSDPRQRSDCMSRLRSALSGKSRPSSSESTTSMAIPVDTESDVVVARTAGRQVCRELGFPTVVQIKVATAISELARNIVQYAGNGVIEIHRLGADSPGIEVLARDEGPGIGNLDDILAGRYRSKSGMGMGLQGTRNLVDDFNVDTVPGRGTRVRFRKYLVAA